MRLKKILIIVFVILFICVGYIFSGLPVGLGKYEVSVPVRQLFSKSSSSLPLTVRPQIRRVGSNLRLTVNVSENDNTAKIVNWMLNPKWFTKHGIRLGKKIGITYYYRGFKKPQIIPTSSGFNVRGEVHIYLKQVRNTKRQDVFAAFNLTHSGSKIILRGSSINIEDIPGGIDRNLVPSPIVVDLNKIIECDLAPNIISTKSSGTKNMFGVIAELDVPIIKAIRCSFGMQ